MDAELFTGVLQLRAQVEPFPKSQGGSAESQAAACTPGSLPEHLGETNNLALAASEAMCAQLPLLSGPSPTRSWWNFISHGAAGSLLAAVSSGTGSLCFPESTNYTLLSNSVA